ncbi:MAG: CRISPR-associated protein Cas5 [Deltaproteobacteria bacterium]|nr:MAG: CRISPR-associated protein Cas5 [Deltaproteobacteria bacterium]
MNLIIFELKGQIGHFRRPDTMGTQATYPFMTRTALRGLIAAILGLEMLPQEASCGLRLLSPVRTVAQEMSMHGKTWVSGGDEKSFHRPTAIELVVKPHYRIYYDGPLADELSEYLRNGQSYYHTYLGSAFCLTFPKWVGAVPPVKLKNLREDEPLTCVSVVPSVAVKHLLAQEDEQYARVGGVLWEYLGDRRFRGTVSFLYEVNGKALRFFPAIQKVDVFWHFYQIPNEGTVCLW